MDESDDFLVSKVLAYYEKMEENHRYKSWEHCYGYFYQNKNFDIEQATLHLAFYLASWGMYRGSSGLLWKDYKIHMPAVEIIRKLEYKLFDDFNWNEDAKEKYKRGLIDLNKKLGDYYGGLRYSSGKKINAPISATPTLITKIILGTIGTFPALDRFFCKGFNKNKKQGKRIFRLDDNSINLIWEFAEDKNNAIKDAQQKIQELNNNRIFYPVMKIIDMYFWNIGYSK